MPLADTQYLTLRLMVKPTRILHGSMQGFDAPPGNVWTVRAEGYFAA